MLYLYTIFDSQNNARPLMSGAYDTKKRELKFYMLWLRGTGRTLAQVEEATEEVRTLISNSKAVMLNDFKQHLIAFNPDTNSKVLDPDLPSIRAKSDPKINRKMIAKIIGKMKVIKPQKWHIVRGMSCPVYAHLQKRGFMYNHTMVYPVWGRVWSGRSKTSGFNVQGGLDSELLCNVNGDDFFINFDWVAADMRAISIMSGDPKLNAAFKDSDPYEWLMDYANTKKADSPWMVIDRSKAKDTMFRSVYSLVDSNYALECYTGFRDWIRECRARLKNKGYLSTILDRRFSISKDRTERSVFNATIQGSVAHAMQLSLRRVWDLYPDKLLTENHDSIVMTARKSEVPDLITGVSRIMTQPFSGILDSNPRFPIKVSIGRGYKNWTFYRRFN